MATARGRATVRLSLVDRYTTTVVIRCYVVLYCVVLYCVVLCCVMLCCIVLLCCVVLCPVPQHVLRRKKTNSHFVGRRLSLVITWCRWPQLHPYPPGVPMNTAQPQCFPASEAPAIVGVGWRWLQTDSRGDGGGRPDLHPRCPEMESYCHKRLKKSSACNESGVRGAASVCGGPDEGGNSSIIQLVTCREPRDCRRTTRVCPPLVLEQMTC